MTLEQVNAILKGKRPVSAQANTQAAANKRPDVATIKARITELRKTVDVLFTQAKHLRAYKLMGDLSHMDVTLAKLETELKK